MRIVYVEDNLTNVSLVRRVARHHQVISYVDGDEALRNFERDNPDLVLMDIQLAGKLDGLQVVQKLRESGHKVPIVAVTAYAMLGDRERCLAVGCDEYIAKPLPIPTLVEIINRYDLEARERAKRATAAVPIIPPDTTEIRAVLAEGGEQQPQDIFMPLPPRKITEDETLVALPLKKVTDDDTLIALPDEKTAEIPRPLIASIIAAAQGVETAPTEVVTVPVAAPQPEAEVKAVPVIRSETAPLDE